MCNIIIALFSSDVIYRCASLTPSELLISEPLPMCYALYTFLSQAISSNPDDKKSNKINRAVQNFFLHSPIYFMSAFLCRVS